MMNFCGRKVYRYLVFVYAATCFTACTVVKNAPENKPFVYAAKIELNKKNLSKDDAKTISANLENYWADSLRVPVVTKYFIKNVINQPAVLDTVNISKSQTYMKGYLNSEGYYQPAFTDSVSIDSTSVPGQKRATVIMDVDPGKATIIDSLGYQLDDSVLQRVALRIRKRTKIVPGKTKFTQQNIADELDRLVGVYRNIGYYQMSRNNLIALADTTDANLLNLTLDPLEQAVKMAQAAARQKENPTVSVTVMKRTGDDTLLVSSRPADFIRYRIGHVNFFPETRMNEIPDSTLLHLNEFSNVFTTRSGNVTIYNQVGKFVPRPMLEHLYFKKGDYYRDSTFFKTINNLNSIGSWQQVDYRNFVRGDTVDVNYFLVPAIKQNITTELQGSINTGNLDAITTANNMFGIGFNASLRNRNVWHRAIQSVTSALAGVEIGIGGNVTNNLVQTFQLGASQSYTFPRFITPFFTIRDKNLDNVRTVLNVSGNYTDRRDYYDLSSVIGNWGYEWRRRNQNWQYRPLNIEVYNLKKIYTTDSTGKMVSLLDEAIAQNPYLSKAFNVGTVISQQLNYNMTFNNSRLPGNNYLRFAVEEAGGLLGLIKSLNNQIYQYFRIEGEYIKHYDFRNTQFAFRAFAGAGFNYAPGSSKFPNTLPFFKQFVAGGPNSMRAWNLRQLGLGSNIQSDTSSTFRDRYGDMQLEMNLEYRFPLFAIGNAIKVNSALFSDIGNVWNVHRDASLPGAEFDISKLGKDVAIAVGTGLRFDFSYVVLRVDFGLKLKDPARAENGGWMNISHFTWQTAYPDGTDPAKKTFVNNYGIQLGIGMPF